MTGDPPPLLPVHTASTASDQRYVDWFMWARAQNLDQQRCHGAAEGACKAETSGADPVPAAVWGAHRARSENIVYSVHKRELCNWYAWAIEERRLQPAQAIVVANAVATAIGRGVPREKAFDIALAYERGERPQLGRPLVVRLLLDPGGLMLVFAFVLVALALLSAPFGAFIAVLALLSMLVPIRAMRQGQRFTRVMGLALLVDLIAVAIGVIGIRL